MSKKYQYAIYTWGGFYNKENIEIHKYNTEGLQVFNSLEERQIFINKLIHANEILKSKYNKKDAILVKKLWEGFDVKNTPVCHRVVSYKNELYYSKSKWNWPENIDVLSYYMEYKWYPGFNDEKVQEENPNEKVDYSDVEIIEEWFTGKFLNYE